MSTKTSARFCEFCGERIIWARTPDGRNQALNREPSGLGSEWAYPGVNGWLCRPNVGDSVHPLEKTYLPHAATCRPEETEEENS